MAGAVEKHDAMLFNHEYWLAGERILEMPQATVTAHRVDDEYLGRARWSRSSAPSDLRPLYLRLCGCCMPSVGAVSPVHPCIDASIAVAPAHYLLVNPVKNWCRIAGGGAGVASETSPRNSSRT